MPRRTGLALTLATVCLLAGCSEAPVPTPPPPPPNPPQAAAPWSYSALNFQDDLRGWAALISRGAAAVARTDDGGATWTRTGAPAFEISALRFADAAHGAALGTSFGCRDRAPECSLLIATTADGGVTWETRYSHILEEGFSDNAPTLEFPDASVGYALYVGSRDSVLLATNDAGNTWAPVAAPAPGWVFQSAAFPGGPGWANARECTAAGREQEDCRYAIFAAADGGKRWVRQLDLPPGRRIRPGSISFVNASDGWLYPTAPAAGCTLNGCSGPLYRTSDGGQTWETITWAGAGPSEGFALAVRFVTPDRGWMLISGGASGGVGTTVDGGKTWVRRLPPGLHDVQLLSAPTALAAWAVGSGPGVPAALFKTVDGGLTWSPVPAPFLH